MELKGSHRLPASREIVWATLSDPAVLKECVPGCEQVELLPNGDTRFVLAVEIGLFKATFTGQARFTSAHPPGRATISGEGRGRPAGSATGTADVELTSEGNDTLVTYHGTAEVGGKLGELPPEIVGAKARDLADKFFKAVARRLPKRDAEFIDRLDHAPAGVPILGDEPSEDVVEDPAERAGEVAKEVEERIEVAAGSGFLGGPMVWGMIAIAVLILILALSLGGN